MMFNLLIYKKNLAITDGSFKTNACVNECTVHVRNTCILLGMLADFFATAPVRIIMAKTPKGEKRQM